MPQFGPSPYERLYGPAPGGRPAGRTTSGRAPKPVFMPVANDKLSDYYSAAKSMLRENGSQLPPALQPRWMRNKVNTSISKGMTQSSLGITKGK